MFPNTQHQLSLPIKPPPQDTKSSDTNQQRDAQPAPGWYLWPWLVGRLHLLLPTACLRNLALQVSLAGPSLRPPQAPTAGALEKDKTTLMAEPREARAHSPPSPLSWMVRLLGCQGQWHRPQRGFSPHWWEQFTEHPSYRLSVSWLIDSYNWVPTMGQKLREALDIISFNLHGNPLRQVLYYPPPF